MAGDHLTSRIGKSPVTLVLVMCDKQAFCFHWVRSLKYHPRPPSNKILTTIPFPIDKWRTMWMCTLHMYIYIYNILRTMNSETQREIMAWHWSEDTKSLQLDGEERWLSDLCAIDYRFAPENERRPWWRHQIETFSALLALCAGNSPVPGELPAQRPVTRSFDVFSDLRSNKRLNKQWWGWWFETQSSSLWRHCNDHFVTTSLIGWA